MDSRIPLPSSIRCPALALFRKYHYPDSAFIDAIKDEKTKEHMKLISQVAVEIAEDGTIQEYGQRSEPEHITRRIRHSNHTSGGSTGGVTDSRTEQKREDAGTSVETRTEEGGGSKEDLSPGGGVPKSTE